MTTVDAFTEDGLRSFLTHRVENVCGQTWREVAGKGAAGAMGVRGLQRIGAVSRRVVAGVSLGCMTRRRWHLLGAPLLLALGCLAVASSFLGDRESLWWASAVSGAVLCVLSLRWLNDVRVARVPGNRR